MMSTSTQTLRSRGKTVQQLERLKPPPDSASDNKSDSRPTTDTSLHRGQQSARQIKGQRPLPNMLTCKRLYDVEIEGGGRVGAGVMHKEEQLTCITAKNKRKKNYELSAEGRMKGSHKMVRDGTTNEVDPDAHTLAQQYDIEIERGGRIGGGMSDEAAKHTRKTAKKKRKQNYKLSDEGRMKGSHDKTVRDNTTNEVIVMRILLIDNMI
jgi:hypothetical protein